MFSRRTGGVQLIGTHDEAADGNSTVGNFFTALLNSPGSIVKSAKVKVKKKHTHTHKQKRREKQSNWNGLASNINYIRKITLCGEKNIQFNYLFIHVLI
jgi:hypothetical protein